MADVRDVAAAVVAQAKSTGVDPLLTGKKLQKLVYYAQAWHLADRGVPLFDDPIEAWEEGPVVRRLWLMHRGKYRVSNIVFGDPSKLSQEQTGLVSEIVDRYGRLSVERLVELTHSEPPWSIARGDRAPSARSDAEIDRDLMRKSYRRSRIRPEDAVKLAIADNRLEGLETSPDAMPYLLAVARGEMSADEAIKERFAAVIS